MMACNEKVSKQENWTFMKDCAKNIIILQFDKSLKVTFTKLTNRLMEILTPKRDRDVRTNNINFEGQMPIDMKKPLFALIDKQLLSSSNVAANPDRLLKADPDQVKSLSEIVNDVIERKTFGTRCHFRLCTFLNNMPDEDDCADSNNFQFYEITVHRRTLNGKPVLEILIDDANSELINSVIDLKVENKTTRENYEESFKATNCHELRTPLLSQKQLARSIIIFLKGLVGQNPTVVKKEIKKLKLMLS